MSIRWPKPCNIEIVFDGETYFLRDPQDVKTLPNGINLWVKGDEHQICPMVTVPDHLSEQYRAIAPQIVSFDLE